ncbi:MAG: carbon monoxide dehydrogenase subunit G [Betaproteobacteria bacterium]|nr:carbon monoxide dehydrogenase subunit G [Betaproteobacteria bacterium]MDE2122814.1 carbon monoxide dehydrogenase subunit G [Betaproteobacteria bacterium]MDE2186481.1 carbon monoxide dehydrogenase subunit G [Betaproteobacteria bacterium]MDE2324438.1 carbon monoxide dehydrogenase subunit G [Betaproteobacteria bacterium]
MDLQGNRPLTVTRQQAWDALNDAAILQQCIPGCEQLIATDPTHYDTTLALRIGPVAAKFKGRLELRDIQPPDSYTIAFDGQGGAAGFGKGEAQVRLADRDDGGGCVLQYTVHATVGGKIAQIGQRLIDGAARSIAEDFFKRFDQQMQALHPAAAVDHVPAETTPAIPGPRKARGLPFAWIAAAVALVLALIWLWHGQT